MIESFSHKLEPESFAEFGHTPEEQLVLGNAQSSHSQKVCEEVAKSPKEH